MSHLIIWLIPFTLWAMLAGNIDNAGLVGQLTTWYSSIILYGSPVIASISEIGWLVAIFTIQEGPYVTQLEAILMAMFYGFLAVPVCLVWPELYSSALLFYDLELR